MALVAPVLHQDFRQASLASAAILGNTATFARGDLNASYFNSSGNLAFVGGTNTPRLQSYAGGANKGLLVEGSRKNVIFFSQGLDVTGTPQWTPAGSSPPVVTANDAVAPDGNTTAELIEGIDLNSVGKLSQNAANRYASDTRYEPSVFIKRVTTTGRMRCSNIQAGNRGTWTINFASLSDNWEWIHRGHPAVVLLFEWQSLTTHGGFQFDDQTHDEGPFDFHCWQVDNQTGPSGEAVLFPSMPIHTPSNATVTRLAETCNIAHSLSSSQGYTVVLVGRSPLGQGAADQVLWEHHDGTTGDSYKVLRATADGKLHAVFRRGAVEVENLDCGALANNTDFTLAFSAGDGDFRASRDGGAVVDNGTLDDAPTGLTTIEVGHDQADANHWFGHVTEAVIFTGTAGNGFLQDPFSNAGTAAQTVPGPSQAGVGEQSTEGTGAQTIPGPSQAAAGSQDGDASGTAAQTVLGPSQAGAGAEAISGTADQLVPAPIQVATGGEAIDGVAAQTIPGPSQAAAGDAGAPAPGTGGYSSLLRRRRRAA